MAQANPPVPSTKPKQSTFQDVIDRAVEEITKNDPMEPPKPRAPKIETTNANSTIVIPPPLPLRKQVIKTVEKNVIAPVVIQPTPLPQKTMVNGIPIPSRKPFKVIVSKDKQSKTVATSKNQVIYYEGKGSSDRMAGGKKPSKSNGSTRGTERIYADRIGRLKETKNKSPFKTARLPKAGKQSYSDPVILFFQERSPKIEVGQMGILKNDVLKPLKRSSSRKVTIYGYAMKNKSKPDAARRLSLSRALMIREYLTDNRIKPDRIEVRTMGSDTQISPKNRVDIVFGR